MAPWPGPVAPDPFGPIPLGRARVEADPDQNSPIPSLSSHSPGGSGSGPFYGALRSSEPLIARREIRDLRNIASFKFVEFSKRRV